MLGAILGDIVGSMYEFSNAKEYNFELFPKGSSFTDDSILTVAVAEAILKKRDYGTSIKNWALRYPNPKGAYGSRFNQWVKSPDIKPYGSFGNGSAMRVSAVGWLFDNEDDVLSEARKSAECTHNHPEGIKGAQATAIAIYLARKGKDKDFIKTYIEDNFGYNLSRSVEEIRKTYSFDESCQGTVPESITCFLESTSFEDAIRKAIYIGGDSDTIGAIAGSIAEAFYGIPNNFLEKTLSYLPSDMLKVIEIFDQRLQTVLPDLSFAQKELSKKYGEFKREFLDLFIIKNRMVSHDEPFFSALYLQKIGILKYELFCSQIELSKLKYRISLLQAFVNRNEKPILDDIDKDIQIAFAEYQKQIENEAEKLAAAKEKLKNGFLSKDEVKNIKDIYYAITKRLHPDINPNLSDYEKDLFLKAQIAYDLGDLQTLKEIFMVIDLPDGENRNVPAFDLKKQIGVLEKNIEGLKKQIDELNKRFPFTYSEQIFDEQWVKTEQETTQKEIELIKEQIEKNKTYVSLLEEWKPE